MRNEILNKVSVNNSFWLSPNHQELFLLGFENKLVGHSGYKI